ncbi:hypothetical protein PISMIDRAFT_677581, partial [Pisolithus microcarpus 441]
MTIYDAPRPPSLHLSTTHPSKGDMQFVLFYMKPGGVSSNCLNGSGNSEKRIPSAI